MYIYLMYLIHLYLCIIHLLYLCNIIILILYINIIPWSFLSLANICDFKNQYDDNARLIGCLNITMNFIDSGTG